MLLARHQRWILLLTVLVAAVAAAALTGCTMVGDATTGVTLERANPSECLKQCSTSQADLVHAEATRHQEQIRACEGLPESEREACTDSEAARHAAAMAEIASGRQDCMNNCHRQGGGNAS